MGPPYRILIFELDDLIQALIRFWILLRRALFTNKFKLNIRSDKKCSWFMSRKTKCFFLPWNTNFLHNLILTNAHLLENFCHFSKHFLSRILKRLLDVLLHFYTICMLKCLSFRCYFEFEFQYNIVFVSNLRSMLGFAECYVKLADNCSLCFP